MRVLFVGDPHLKINRFDLAVSFLTWINKIIAEQKPDLVVNLGDTFDTHAVLRSEVLNEFMKHVSYVLNLKIPYVYLLGNHDCFRPNDAKYHALRPFKDRIKDFYVVDEVCNLFDMTFIPYHHDTKNYPTTTLPVVVARQTFTGADYGAIRDKEGVDRRRLSLCELIISGHIHTRQRLVDGEEGPELLYVGTPFSQSAADIDQIKGVTLIDMATYAETFIETPMPTWRRFCGSISEQQTAVELHEALSHELSGSKDHWIIELEGPKAEIVAYLESKQYAAAIVGVDVQVRRKFTDKDKKKLSIEAKSMDHIVSEFIAKVYSGSIDKDELVRHALAILQESRAGK